MKLPTLCLMAALATLSTDSTMAAEAPLFAALRETSWPLLPQGIASFGAAVQGPWLYVYGGHTGRPHTHSTANISPSFRRLNLLDRSTFEELPFGTPMQSVALVSNGKFLYRIGGMEPRNPPGEEESLHSSVEFQRFDTEQRTWEALPDLPEARSSHDAVVIDQKIYVIGGWTLAGSRHSWLQTAWVIDLAQPNPTWEELPPPPFRRRALAVGHQSGRLIAMGGITPEGQVSQQVDIFDLESQTWSRGPEFPEGAFGVSAFATRDRLYASGMKGVLYGLDEALQRWESVATLAFPRFFHRLLETRPGELVAVGGACRGGHTRVIESIDLEAEAPSVVRWRIPFPDTTRSRQGVLVWGHQLYVAGGNNGTGDHDFAPENFSREAFEINLGNHRVTRLGSLPAPRQSFGSLLVELGHDGFANGDFEGMRSRQLLGMLVGGFGFTGDNLQTQHDVLLWEAESKSFVPSGFALPAGRTQFSVAHKNGRLWLFGGLDYNAQRKDPFAHPADVLTYSFDGSEQLESSGVRLPQPRRAHAGVNWNGKHVLLGGMKDGFELVGTCDVFDFESRQWSSFPPPQRTRLAPMAATVLGKIYLAGGESREEGGNVAADPSVEVFDPANQSWSLLLNEMPVPAKQARMFAYRDRLLFFSTFEQPGVIDIALVNLPRQDPASPVAPLAE